MSRVTILGMCGIRHRHSLHEGGTMALWMRSCAVFRALGSLGVSVFSLQTSRHSKVGWAHVCISHCEGLIQFPPQTTGELKVLILRGLDGRGQAAVRLHENADNDEDGCLWRMRSEDDGVLRAVKQALAG